MKQRFIIVLVIFAVILSGCSIEDKKAIAEKGSSYVQENKDTAGNSDKEIAKETSNAPAQSYLESDKPSVSQISTTAKNSTSSQVSVVKKDVQAGKNVTMSVRLYNYLSVKKNRDSVGNRANELHGGTMHNSCVYYASEALRRVGVRIPDSMSLIPKFIAELKRQGFKTSYNLKDLKPGDICFTTDVNGVFGGRPTHTYIFMGWKSPGVAWIADNQIYDYGDVYHARSIDFHYLNNQKDKAKEATAFFMYK